MSSRYSSRYSLRTTAVRKAYNGDTPGSKRRVQKLKNGLLSLGHTPEYLISRVRNNSINSPLMSLPAEIRLKIWDYATGEMRIYFETGTSVEYSIDGDTIKHGFDIDRHFSLSRVCRQICSEIGTKFYQFNVFSFEDAASLMRFQRKLKRAQGEALYTIAVSAPLVMNVRLCRPRARRLGVANRCGIGRNRPLDVYSLRTALTKSWPWFTETFPELRTIIVYGEAADVESIKALEIVKTKENSREVIFE
ncbi:hypothetical protein CC86DRAFT_401811 [Ophiobolus disseminans]|uniref:Uncharacterized protein n=1 Tax=Ophiobolus disseminans TaxID=1469910 RepID=A0A6A7AEX2_9PLEO|nr:hypothetical protein CC86DRAFT_401811 [Ophiobolus disseminans]